MAQPPPGNIQLYCITQDVLSIHAFTGHSIMMLPWKPLDPCTGS